MKTFAMAAVAATALAQSPNDWPSIDLDQFEEKTFTQLLDHVNYLDDRTYEQRYWVSDQYWDGTGPIFIYICGEYRCSVPETRLFPFMLGATHNARFMVLEHRFYGDSQPFDTWELQNFSYLNSEQALADLAYFIGEMNPGNKNQVLVIGGSYPGAMSAWFRNRYPHLTVGSWSSSGVVQPIVDFWRFDEQTYLSSVKSGDYCPRMIRETMDYVTRQAAVRDDGNPDNVIDATLAGTGSEGMRSDDWMFFYADIFLESVQYGNRTRMCDLLKENEQSSNDEIVQVMVDFGHNVANVNPIDYDTRVISQTTVDPFSSSRPWTFQYCSEYGWFQVPSEEHSMRSDILSMPFWPEMCKRSFGEGMRQRPAAEETTIDQGGLDIGVTNVFFANGVEDPWKWATQMRSNPELNQVARVSDCDNCGHCVELYTPAEDDAPELVETRKMITNWVGDLLNQTRKETTVEFLQ